MTEAAAFGIATAGASVAIAIVAVSVATATVVVIESARRVRRATRLPQPSPKRRSNANEHCTHARRSPPVLPPSQELPVHWRQCAEDRLQGRAAVAALCLRARQDRAESYHCGVRQEAARTGAGDQAGALSRIVALRDPVTDTHGW